MPWLSIVVLHPIESAPDIPLECIAFSNPADQMSRKVRAPWKGHEVQWRRHRVRCVSETSGSSGGLQQSWVYKMSSTKK